MSAESVAEEQLKKMVENGQGWGPLFWVLGILAGATVVCGGTGYLLGWIRF